MKLILNFIYTILLQDIIIQINTNAEINSYEDVVEDRKLLKATKTPHVLHFNYGIGPKGSKFWSSAYPKCGGRMQSPINIDLRTVKEVKLEDLNWKNYDVLPNVMSEVNNGHTISVSATYPNFVRPIISGGPLTEQYEFFSLHFHWGMNDNIGSEHIINDRNFIMEMHCIHKKKDLDIGVASDVHNGLVVISYFFELGVHDNPLISNILEKFTKLLVDVDVDLQLLNTFKLTELMILFKTEYITYQGSLTTPPCSESVIWILCPYPVFISTRQLEMFRKISQATGMANNYRPVQSIGNRTVYLITNDAEPIAKMITKTGDDD